MSVLQSLFRRGRGPSRSIVLTSVTIPGDPFKKKSSFSGFLLNFPGDYHIIRAAIAAGRRQQLPRTIRSKNPSGILIQSSLLIKENGSLLKRAE
jgi:hypothetical protein